MAMERNQVPANLKWRVEDIYESVDEWNKVYASLEDKLDFSKYEGKLGEPELLLECLQGVNAVSIHLVQLAVYAHMRHDEDTRSSEFTALQSRLDMLWMKLMGSTAFIEPELTELPVEYLEGLIADDRFKDYDYTLRQTIKRKPHVLSKEIEALLSQESRVFGPCLPLLSRTYNSQTRIRPRGLPRQG